MPECAVSWCERPLDDTRGRYRSRTYCRACLAWGERNPGQLPDRPAPATPGECAVEWCDRPRKGAKDYCNACLNWAWRTGGELPDRPKPTKGRRPKSDRVLGTCKTPWCERPEWGGSSTGCCKACMHWWYRSDRSGEPWERPQPEFTKKAPDGSPQCKGCPRSPAPGRRWCWACAKRKERDDFKPADEFVDRRRSRRATAPKPKPERKKTNVPTCHMCKRPKGEHTPEERRKCAHDLITKPPEEPKQKTRIKHRGDAGVILQQLG